MKKICFMIAMAIVSLQSQAQIIATFDDLQLFPESYLNGSGASVSGKFSSGHAQFPNVYQTSYGGFWSTGWAYSSMQNDTTAGYKNMYASFAAEGYNQSQNYGVGQEGSIVRITGGDAGNVVKGLYVTNGTYAAISMRDGDGIGKQFGGSSGNDPDYFVLTIKAYFNGALTSDSVNFYLADFRFANNAQDYIVKNWTWIDLSTLGNTDSLLFELSSSDNGQFGMNTPAFFCVDNIITNSDTADFEGLSLSVNQYWNRSSATLHEEYVSAVFSFPCTYSVSSYGDYWSSGFAISNMTDTTTAGFDNMYSAITGKGYDTSTTYAVVQNNSGMPIPIIPDEVNKLRGIYVTNTTYAALSMKNGDAFAKKFGGATGTDPDYFILTTKAWYNGTMKQDSVNFYLADFRSNDNTQDYIVTDWRWVDLTILGIADSLAFSLSSSDNGQFGMNTPGFFAMDNLTVDFSIGLNELAEEIHALVYPNPTSSVLHVDAGNNTVKNIFMYDLAGKLVMQTSATTIDVSSLNNGLYLLQIQTAEGSVTKRFIKN